MVTQDDPDSGRGSVTRTRSRHPVESPAATAVALAAVLTGFWPVTGVPGGGLAAQEVPVVGSRTVERPVSMDAAISRAREHNATLRMARDGARAASGEAGIARSALLPQLAVRAGWVRSDDPVAAFGTKLRHRSFTSRDLALAALNRPAPQDDWTGAVGLQWAGLDPAAWQRRIAADRGADAARLSARWAEEATDYRTRVLYVEAASAEARLDAARAARAAAAGTLERFRRRHDEGLLTRAELLQARAELEAARAGVEDAARLRTEARLLLGVHLGWGADTVPVPMDTLALPPEPGRARRSPNAPAPASRADLRAMEARVEAAEAGLRASRAEFLPSAHLFGELSRHSAEPFGDGGTHWSVGAGIELPLFAGGRRLAGADVAEAQLRSARAALDGALREATTEVVRAREAVDAARRVVDASTAAHEAAVEGRELMRRRFEEGLASAADLLAAEARTAAMRGRAVEALAAYHTARARLELVSGPDGAEGERGTVEGER